MGTTTNPAPPLSPDDAYTAFKAAEGAYNNAVAQKTGTASALAAATQADSDAGNTVNSTASTVSGASQDLIGALQAFQAGLPQSPPASTT